MAEQWKTLNARLAERRAELAEVEDMTFRERAEAMCRALQAGVIEEMTPEERKEEE